MDPESSNKEELEETLFDLDLYTSILHRYKDMYYGSVEALFDRNAPFTLPISKVAQALAETDTKRNESDDTDFVERGYLRTLRQAIEEHDWLLQVEALKSIGDLYLEIGKKTGDERNFYFALRLYLKAVSRCHNRFVRDAAKHRVFYTIKCIEHPPKRKIPYSRRQYSESDNSEDWFNFRSGMVQCLNEEMRQGRNGDVLIDLYIMMMVRAIMHGDVMVEFESVTSIGNICATSGYKFRAVKIYDFAEEIETTGKSKAALQHRQEDVREVRRRIWKDIDPKLSRNGNDEVKKNGETNSPSRSYAELHLAAETALQNGDLDAAEQHFASALRQVHVVQDPQRLQEEEECLRKLGEVYVRRGEQTKDGQDFAKATALYNAALARNGDKQLLIDSIKEAERLFLLHTVGIDCKPSSYETDIQHKDRLEKYRNEVEVSLGTIQKNHNPYKYDEGDPLVKEVEGKRAEAIKDLFKAISGQRKDFIKDLVEECVIAIGLPPCQYAMVGLGSQATELVTPYSDLEFAILIEENKDTPKNKEYFLNLTCYLYLKVINLGETILPAVAIKSLNDFHSEDPADSWFYDSVTPRGFAFDGAMPWASKTPFGREKTRSKIAVSLIQTPAGMAEFQRHDIALAHGYHLSSILRYVSYLTGNQTLVDDYRARVIQELDASAGRFARAALTHTMQENWGQQLTDKALDVKKEIYRFPTVAVMNLGLFGGVYTASVWDAIKQMEEAGVVTEENAHHLQVLVSISGELRLRTYLELGGQKENLSGLLGMQKQQDYGNALLKSVFHVPDQKMLFRFHYTASPLKTCILGFTMGTTTPLLGQKALYDASPKVKAQMCTEICHFKAGISHTEEALRELEEGKDTLTRLQDEQQNLSSKAFLLGHRAKSYSRLGDHRNAISFWEEQLKIQQQLHRSYSAREMFFTHCNLLSAYHELEDGETMALAHIKRMFPLLNKVFKPEHVNQYQEIFNFASKQFSRLAHVFGDHRMTMMSNSEEMLDIYNKLFEENIAFPLNAELLKTLGKEFNRFGNYTKAITCIEKSLKLMKITYGQDTAHPDIAESLTMLGDSLCKGRDDHVNAARCYEEALEMNRVIYGKDTPHPVTADILNSLGEEWRHLRQHQKSRSCYLKSVSYYEEAMTMLEEGLSKNKEHPDLAWLLGKLGSAWRKAGEHTKSLHFYQRALEMNKAIHGQNAAHTSIFISLWDLAAVNDDLKDHAKAVQLYEEALNMLKVIHGGNGTNGENDVCHPNISRALSNLGAVCRNAGEYQKSMSYYKRALEMNKAVHGQDAAHPDIADSLRNVADVYGDLGNYTKASQLYQEALSMLKIVHGGNEEHEGEEPRHAEIAYVLNNIGVLWFTVGDNEKARTFFEQALKMYQYLYGETTPNHNTAIALGNMGEVSEKSGENFEAINFYEDTLKMLTEVLEKSTEHPNMARMLGNLGSAYRKTGEHVKSLQYCEWALDMIERLRGQDAAYIAATLRIIATVYEDLGDNTKAIQLYEDALHRVKTNRGPNTPHPDTAISLNKLGEALEKSGDIYRAISLYEEALTMMEEVWDKGTEHPDIAEVLSNLGSAYRKAGKHGKSLHLYQRALKINKRTLEKKICVYGEDAVQPSIAKSLSNLAKVYEHVGDHTKAIQLYEDALNMLKIIHGTNETHGEEEPHHPHTAGVLTNLGDLWHTVGDNEKARVFFEQALNMYKELYGPTTPHLDTAKSLANVGLALGKSGENFKAISYYEQSLKMLEEVLINKDHPRIAWLLGNLGSACRKTGEYTKSRQYYERALETNKAIRGQVGAHPSISKSLCNLANAHDHLGDHTKAVQLYEEALNMTKAIHGGEEPNHPDIARVLSHLGRLSYNVGDNEKALLFFDQEMKMKRELHGHTTPHRSTARSLSNLAVALEKSGDFSKAVGCYEEALTMLEEVIGKTTNHPDIAWVLGNLGSACHKAGEHTKSLQYCEKALEMIEAFRAENVVHANIAASLREVAAVYEDLGNYRKAIQLYEEALNMLKVIHGGNVTHGDEARHPSIAHVLRKLGCLWYKVGDNEKARAFFEQELKMNQQLYGPTTPHHDTAISLGNIGAALEESGDNIKAIRLYEESLTMLEEVLGDKKGHPDIVRLLGNLGRACHMTGEYTKSLQCYERVLDINKGIHGEEAAHPSIVNYLSNLAAVYEDLGEHTKAIQLYQDALRRVQTVQGAKKSHPDILKLLGNLEKIYNKVGDQEKASSYRDQARTMKKATAEREDTDSTDHKE